MWKKPTKLKKPEKISIVFDKVTQRLGLLVAGDEIVISERLKKQVVDTLDSDHPGSAKIVSRIQYFLVVRNEKGHRKQNQYMHCVHEFR